MHDQRRGSPRAGRASRRRVPGSHPATARRMRVEEIGPPPSCTGGTTVQAHAAAPRPPRQEGDVAAAAVAEGEILARRRGAGRRGPCTALLDEGFRGIAAKAASKVRAKTKRAPAAASARPWRAAGSAGRAGLRAEMLARMRLEGQRRERRSGRAACAAPAPPHGRGARHPCCRARRSRRAALRQSAAGRWWRAGIGHSPRPSAWRWRLGTET